VIADRWVLSTFAPRFAAALAAGLAVYSAVEVVDLANQAGGGGLEALLAYPLRIPLGLVLVSPLAMLLGGCWTAIHLARSGQLTGLEAAGRGPRRGVLLPLAVVGAIWAGLVWGVANEVAPRGLARWAGGRAAEGWPRWVRGGDLVLYRLGRPDGRGGYLDVLALETDREGGAVARIEAERAERVRERWELVGATSTTRGRPARRDERIAAPAPIPTPTAAASPQEMTASALGRAVDAARATGSDPAPLGAERGLRTALAAACPVCVALGLFAGIVFGRSPGLAAAAAAAGGMLYFSVVSPLWAMATVGAVSGEVVAWVPAGAIGAVTAALWSRPPREA
jgi:lipopolysaccharide export LptBFGC system permease protein LptF